MASFGTANGVTLKGRVMYEPEVREFSDGKRLIVCHLVTKDGIVELYIDEKHHKLFKRDIYMIIKNSMTVNSTPGTYRVAEKSSVFYTAQMEINCEALKDFWNPVPISVPDALCTPKKKRVSVVGYIQNVGDTITSANSRKRKFIDISPSKEMDKDTEMIKLKLWGDVSEIEIPPQGTKVNIKGVIISDFNYRKDLNSTIHTEIEECSDIEDFGGVVEGIIWDSTSSNILMDDNIFVCESDILLKVATYNTTDLVEKKISGTKRGSKIISINVESERSNKKIKAN